MVLYFDFRNYKMKLAIVLNLVALGMCTVNSFKFDTVIEEEWNLFKVNL